MKMTVLVVFQRKKPCSLSKEKSSFGLNALFFLILLTCFIRISQSFGPCRISGERYPRASLKKEGIILENNVKNVLVETTSTKISNESIEKKLLKYNISHKNPTSSTKKYGNGITQWKQEHMKDLIFIRKEVVLYCKDKKTEQKEQLLRMLHTTTNSLVFMSNSVPTSLVVELIVPSCVECMHYIWSLGDAISRKTVTSVVDMLCNSKKSVQKIPSISFPAINKRKMKQEKVTLSHDVLLFRLVQRLLTEQGIDSSRRVNKSREEHLWNKILQTFVKTYPNMKLARQVFYLQHYFSSCTSGTIVSPPPLTNVGYSILIKGFVLHTKDIKKVDNLWNHAKQNNIEEDTIMYNSLIDAYITCDPCELTKAECIVREMNEKKSIRCEPNSVTYNTILKGYAKKGLLKEALLLLQIMEEKKLRDDVTTNTLVNIAVSVGEFERAEELLKDWYDESPKTNNKKFHPNVQAYTELIDGYAKTNKLAKSFEIFQLMLSKKIPPNEITMTCLLHGLALQKKVDSIWKLFEYMHQTLEISLTCITFNAILSGLLLLSNSSTKEEELQNKQEDETFYNGRIDHVISFYKFMISYGIRPNETTISILIFGLSKCKPHRLEELDSIVNDPLLPYYLKRRFQIHPTCNNVKISTALLKAYSNTRQYYQMKHFFFHEMQQKDVIALNTFLDITCNMNDLSVSLNVFQNYCVSSKNIIKPNVQTFSILISGILKLDHAFAFERVQTLYQMMKNDFHIQPDLTLVDIIIKVMYQKRTLGYKKEHVHFLLDMLEDAVSNTKSQDYLKRSHVIKQTLVKSRTSEIWKKHGWNEVDSSFPITLKHETKRDSFLQSKGWNDVSSSFRII